MLRANYLEKEVITGAGNQCETSEVNSGIYGCFSPRNAIKGLFTKRKTVTVEPVVRNSLGKIATTTAEAWMGSDNRADKSEETNREVSNE
ncbi:hypothetical protein [Haloarcula sp. CBA1122]|uniref:hypothetical protein n=1 Tax=Haloarcula sp. CBA1122 TaxID=2668069 RepID=UPI00130A03F2|nr:hypothetical protein [Haloarcula sp. CBA1122]MUV48291.1 hypothetical protein [Haloarcula sp. CBA1122]